MKISCPQIEEVSAWHCTCTKCHRFSPTSKWLILGCMSFATMKNTERKGKALKTKIYKSFPLGRNRNTQKSEKTRIVNPHTPTIRGSSFLTDCRTCLVLLTEYLLKTYREHDTWLTNTVILVRTFSYVIPNARTVIPDFVLTPSPFVDLAQLNKDTSQDFSWAALGCFVSGDTFHLEQSLCLHFFPTLSLNHWRKIGQLFCRWL